MGQSEEFSAQGRRPDAAARRSGQSDGQFPRRDRGRTTRISRRPIPTRSCIARATGKEAKLAYLGHVLLDNRHGLVANVCATAATGTAEREAALLMLDAGRPARRPSAATSISTSAGFVAAVARSSGSRRTSRRRTPARAIDGRTTRHPGYAISQRKRKLIEQVFGWMKTIGGLRKLRHRGGELVDWIVTFTAAAYNLVRLRTLLARPA